jgi:aspartyl aminopeptidase
LSFIGDSPTPFHAVANLASQLEQSGYRRLFEDRPWPELHSADPAAEGKYYIIRNDSSLCAFTLNARPLAESGLRMIGAHTDSPCLKVKPHAIVSKKGYVQLAVEVYGGVLLNPWFDRDLSLAGRVSVEGKDGSLAHYLIDFRRPLAVVPSLAIHLDREANSQRSINAQTDLLPIVMRLADDKFDFHDLLRRQLEIQYPELEIGAILDHELSLYDCQAPAMVGINQEFMASARLDNLLSCYVGLQTLLQSQAQPALLICNDHEEVGSASTSGAQGTLLRSVLERLTGDSESFARMIARSLFVSADNTHGVHPNYPGKHDENHSPLLNAGPVIKVNNNQRYATNSITSALFRQSCKNAGVPVQNFVTRNDMACGSTIGPLTATKLGVRTIDVGVPSFAMHSIRELGGSDDAWYLFRAVSDLFSRSSMF